MFPNIRYKSTLYEITDVMARLPETLGLFQRYFYCKPL